MRVQMEQMNGDICWQYSDSDIVGWYFPQQTAGCGGCNEFRVSRWTAAESGCSSCGVFDGQHPFANSDPSWSRGAELRMSFEQRLNGSEVSDVLQSAAAVSGGSACCDTVTCQEEFVNNAARQLITWCAKTNRDLLNPAGYTCVVHKGGRMQPQGPNFYHMVAVRIVKGVCLTDDADTGQREVNDGAAPVVVVQPSAAGVAQAPLQVQPVVVVQPSELEQSTAGVTAPAPAPGAAGAWFLLTSGDFCGGDSKSESCSTMEQALELLAGKPAADSKTAYQYYPPHGKLYTKPIWKGGAEWRGGYTGNLFVWAKDTGARKHGKMLVKLEGVDCRGGDGWVENGVGDDVTAHARVVDRGGSAAGTGCAYFWHRPSRRLIEKPKSQGSRWSAGDGTLWMWVDGPAGGGGVNWQQQPPSGEEQRRLPAPHPALHPLSLEDLSALSNDPAVEALTFTFGFDDFCDDVFWADVNVRAWVQGEVNKSCKQLTLRVPYVAGAVLAVSGTDMMGAQSFTIR